MSKEISKELFNEFSNSEWPREFSRMAQAARHEGVTLDNLTAFPAYETTLIVAPKEEQEMLEEMGIIEDEVLVADVGTPTVQRNYIPRHNLSPHVWTPRYTQFGKQVIMACENLFTPEDHAAADQAAQPELERLLAEGNAEFGVEAA